MVEAMKIPEDDFFQLTHEMDEANFNYDPNYFGIPRSEKMVFIQFFFNARAASAKQIIFKTIADKLVQSLGLRREDLIMNIVETAPESWWIEGREVDPRTGTDSRMK